MRIMAFHNDELSLRTAEDYVGSPMYRVIEEHGLAAFATLVVLALAFLVRRQIRNGRASSAAADRYLQLPTIHRFLFWLLALAATAHLGLIPSHELSLWSAAYAGAALAEASLARAVLWQAAPRRTAILILLGSIVGYAATGLGGTAPDQLGLATKLIELAALAVFLQPRKSSRFRNLASSTALIATTLVVGLGAWVGAFAGDGGHHVGESAGPGTLIPRGEDREPDVHEIAAAAAFYEQVVAATKRYADPGVAAGDGYQIGRIVGHDHHAANSMYQNDGRVLDAQRPENLIYADGPDGAVLVGVMFEMEEIGVPGPAIGGPLTVWHGHDHVCFSVTPPALAGLTSPFGVCPLGSLTVPLTAEMLHVWTVPGAPDRFGHLEEDWLDAYLRGEPLPEPTQEASK